MNSSNKKFIIGLVIFLCINTLGFLFYYFSGWSVLDSLYMVVITIFGVGFGEVKEMSRDLRIFTMLFIVIGCTSLIYTIGTFLNWLTEGQLNTYLGRRKMNNDISHLTGHVVICGFGRVGNLLAEQLHNSGKPFLIIDQDKDTINKIKEKEYLYIQGDATEQSILESANIKTASAIATVIPNDAVNVFIVLSCRALNPHLTIIARASQESTEAKLKQAGAHKVVMPASIGADRIAQIVLKPSAQEILEHELHDNAFIEGLSEIGLEIDEIPVDDESPINDCTLSDLETEGKSTFLVVAIKKAKGETIIKPSLDTQIHAGDTLIVMSHLGTAPDFTNNKLHSKKMSYRGSSY